ncbi:MAG: Gfo/Idh/MocA family oxidoreductase [Acidimicrobiia bacterium]|nr:Gfo/Idh/MocA family oxidoreductase [Acidimicrobiia bacterium]MDH4306441.1 Gfo/Idh/MocA family oxidoreductase [Acidimicrobiia bacterium]MDH5294609.1 Gfo/Idh/MocA family oxidoreductase [Acidimicrobiia bacterium]
MNRRTVGIGVVGSGRIGTHRALLASQHPAVSYLRLADLSEEAVERLGEETAADETGTDPEALVADPAVDAVVVATPEDAHFDAARLALEAGKPVLVEKPLALDPKEAAALVDLSRETGVDLRVGYSARYLQKYFVSRDQVRQGKIGTVIGGWSRVYSSRAQGLAILGRSVHATPVADIVTYLVDLVGWYLPDGVVPVEATARGNGVVFRDHGYDVDDITSATLTYSDGSVFGFDVCYMLPMGFPTTGQSIRFEMFGSDGVVLIDDDHRDQILFSEQGYRNAYASAQEVNLVFLGSRSSGEWAQGKMFGRIADETRAWLDHLGVGTPCHLTTATEAYVTLAATTAIEEAALSKTSVRVDLSAIGR